MLAYLVFTISAYQPLVYSGSLGYLILVAENVIAGVVLGLFANICTFILSFAGQIMDMQIGFSMATEFDPANRLQTYSSAVPLSLRWQAPHSLS